MNLSTVFRITVAVRSFSNEPLAPFSAVILDNGLPCFRDGLFSVQSVHRFPTVAVCFSASRSLITSFRAPEITDSCSTISQSDFCSSLRSFPIRRFKYSSSLNSAIFHPLFELPVGLAQRSLDRKLFLLLLIWMFCHYWFGNP